MPPKSPIRTSGRSTARSGSGRKRVSATLRKRIERRSGLDMTGNSEMN